LRQLFSRDCKASSVATGSRKLTQSVEKTECLQNCGVDSDADSRITPLDSLQSGATGEGAISYDACGQTASPPGIVEVLAKLAERAADRCGRTVRRRH